MAYERTKKYSRSKPEVNKIFDDLEEYLEFCKWQGYTFDESHLYNEKTAWGEMQRVKNGKPPKDNWTARPKSERRDFRPTNVR